MLFRYYYEGERSVKFWHYLIIFVILITNFGCSQDIDSKEKSKKITIIPGFTYLYQATYSCGGETHAVHEYLHDRTNIKFVLLPSETHQTQYKGQFDKKTVPQNTLAMFLISKYEITQRVWEKVMKNNPSIISVGDNYPINNTSWYDAHNFCMRTGLSLPTEAQWEYACRAGTCSKYYWGNDKNGISEYAWYYGNFKGSAQPVGKKKPNAFGLHDMIGNVWEWCNNPYSKKTGIGVCRGSFYAGRADICQSKIRMPVLYKSSNFDIGFRVVKNLQKK